jgi:hypothetical protein
MLVENLFSVDDLSSSAVVRIPLNLSFWAYQGKNKLKSQNCRDYH